MVNGNDWSHTHPQHTRNMCRLNGTRRAILQRLPAMNYGIHPSNRSKVHNRKLIKTRVTLSWKILESNDPIRSQVGKCHDFWVVVAGAYLRSIGIISIIIRSTTISIRFQWLVHIFVELVHRSLFVAICDRHCRYTLRFACFWRN